MSWNAKNNLTPLSHTGGLFTNAGAVLTFLAAIKGARLNEKQLRIRSSIDQRWWAEVPVPWQSAAILVASARGRPYAGQTPLWSVIPQNGPPRPPVSRPPPDGTVLLENLDHTERLLPMEWSEVKVHDLISAISLHPSASSPLVDEVVIITLNILSSVILYRLTQFGFTTEVIAVERTHLLSHNNLTINETARISIPWCLRYDCPVAAYLQGLFLLPSTIVARSVGLENPHTMSKGNLLVDLRYHCSLAVSLFAALVPGEEQWLLCGPELGHWRLRPLSTRTGTFIRLTACF